MSTIDTPGAADAVDYDPFAGAEIARVVPTTEPQREVWLADRLGRDASLAYNESVSLRLKGALDAAALAGALSDLVSRHESLRATFAGEGAELAFAATPAIEVPVTDLSSAGPAAQEAAIVEAKLRVVETPFELERGPLFRAEVLRFAAADHMLLLTAHHIVCDGWSFGVLVRDLARLYELRTGRPVEPLAPADSYADYSIGQAAAQGGDAGAADERYWLSRFSGPAPVLDLPTDRPRPAWRTFASRREDHVLDAALVAEARKLGARNGAGLFGVLLAAFGALMQRLAGTDDVVIGIPAAGQSVGGHDDLVGHCVNMLPLRLAVDGQAPATALVSATQSALLDAYEHQAYTFGTLLRKLVLARDPSRLPLVSVVFNIDQALDAEALSFGGLHVDFATVPRTFENFELFVNAVQAPQGLILECQYNRDLFDQATVRRWLASYETLLRAMCAPGQSEPLAALDVVSRDDREQLAKWNATERPYEAGLRLGELAARGAALQGGAPAVVFEARSVARAQLDDAAWALALELRRQGVKPGVLVGVCLERSVELVTALLGVAYSGGAYVPLDPSYPAERIARMCEDAAMTFVVTRGEELARVSGALPQGARIVRLDAAPLPPAPAAGRVFVGTDTDPAYVIFTSGSTGRPKGAMNSHRGIANRLLWMQEAYRIGPTHRVMQKTPYSFDVSVWEFFWPLMTGATIVVARPDGHREPGYLRDLIVAERVTLMHFVPSMLRAFLDQEGVEACSVLERVICSGEGLPYDAVEAFYARLPRTQLTNLYGPTEAAVDVTEWECRPRDPSGIVPIGRPIANTQIHILDDRMKVVPIGSRGELYIGGVQVGMGYVARPDLTAERFLPDPFRAGGKLYKTGDVARWRGDGSIEHLGRADFQVKVRGFRIELGEIEAALAACPGVAQPVVMAREDRKGDVRLVAYVQPQAGAKLDEEALKARVKATLPEYMVPAHVVFLDAIPLLSNGKVDRKALPAPQLGPRTGAEHVAPRNPMEVAVAKEMEVALGLPGIGVHDDFFALGGHSLLAAQLTSRLNRALGTHLTMRSVFTAPTIARLAEAIEVEGRVAQPHRKAITRLADRSLAPASVAQERLWFLEELNPGRVTYNAPSAHRLVGPMNAEAFERAFREMVRRQPALRTSFERQGSAVVQRIHEAPPAPLFPAEDLSGLAPAERESRLTQRLQELTAETFDLTKSPLYKARLFRLGPEEHAFFFMPHHIVWDGWSFDLLYQEMAALYGAYCAGREAALPELAVTYGDFAAWHRDWIEGPEYGRQLEFWRGRLEKLGAVRDLPSDRPRKPGMSGAGNTEWMSLDRARGDGLHALSRKAGTTLFTTGLAIYATLLHGYSGQGTLVIGTPVRGRNSLELETVMGFFNNLVPLQLEVDPAERFDAFLERVRGRVVEGFAYPDVPLEVMATELATAGGTRGGTLLYQALFSFQDARGREKRWGGLEHRFIPLFQKGATEDLGMWLLEGVGGLEGGVTYNTEILEASTARALREGYVALIDAVLADPQATVGALIERAAIRRASPQAAAEPARPARAAHGPVPETETEKLLASLWCETLKLPSVSTQDNFFDLGGHSLLAMQAILAMEQKTGRRIDRGRYIFETLGQIARAYDSAPAEPAAKEGGLKKLLGGLFGGKR